MSISNVNPATLFQNSPLPHPDLGRQVFQYLTLRDVGSCFQVNKAWHETINNQLTIWLTMFDNEKIPTIPSRPNTVKEDFFFMRKITLSKRHAAPIGVFVGEVPPISEKTFCFFKYGKDRFIPTKYNDQTHVVIVEPTHFIVPYDAAFLNSFHCLFDVDAYSGDNEDFEYRVDGDDIEIDEAKTTMKIPYSWYSVMQLGLESWSKMHMDGGLFFGRDIDKDVSRIFKETVKVSKTVNVYIMRIDPPEIVRNQKYSIQKQILKAKGYEVAPLTPRIYFNMIEYFSKGKCVDGNQLAMRTSDVTEDVLEDLSEKVGSKISEFKNVGIGDPLILWNSTFPLITIIDESRFDDEVSAVAGFPAELEGFEQMPGGIKRTHDRAFGTES